MDMCLTPNNQTGNCIAIRSCPVLLSLVNGSDQPIKTYLRRSFCGWISENGNPKVCCPFNIDPGHFNPSIFRTASDADVAGSPKSISPTQSSTPTGSTSHTKSTKGPYKCGLTNRKAVKIVGGQDASLGDWPWIAAIYYRSKSDTHPTTRCSGTLISKDWVVTAAHCFVDQNLVPFSVRLGDLNLDETVADGATPIDVPIEEVLVHPNFTVRPPVNDIALLRLKNPVEFTEQIHPVCLFNQSETFKSSSFYTNKAPFIMGWGKQNFEGSVSSMLQEAQVDVIDKNVCSKNYVNHNVVIDDRVLCAGGKGKDTCKGDSGGPLIIPIGSKHYLAGIVSFGVGCGDPSFPGVYTRVVEFLSWIAQVTQLSV